MTRDPIELRNPELRRQGTIEKIIDRHGPFIDVPIKFMVRRGLMSGLYGYGYDRTGMMLVYDGFSGFTVHRERKFEKEVTQLMMAPQINVIPGVGALGEKETPKKSIISKAISFIRGTKEDEGTE